MKAFLFGLVLILCGIYGCASIPDPVIPDMKARTLLFSADEPMLYYQWRVCTKHFLGSCTKWEMKRENYDLRDPLMRKQLNDMGFVAKVRDNILP